MVSPHRLPPIFALLSISLAVPLGACGGGGNGSGAECSANMLPGDLVITEVMANPAGKDDGQEWFEIYNATSAPIDLTGVVLAAGHSDGTSEKTHTMDQVVIDADDYLVVGGVLPELKPDYVDYGYGGDLTLGNSGGKISLRCADTEVDSAVYPDAGDDGVSLGLDGNKAPDSLANDSAENFCPATVEFTGGNFGSPGEPNEACNVVTPGQCNDEGTMRPVVTPQVGDLIVTEVMPNPAAVNDSEGEWFEVYATRDVDLNGLVAGKTPGSPSLNIDQADCLSVSAGTYLVFERNSDSTTNGGLPTATATFNFGLVNTAGSLFIGVGDTVLDQITWSSSTAGASRALDPGALDPTANDDDANWSDCGAVYGDGDKGTPGASNDLCSLPEGMCMDGGTLRPVVAPVEGDLTINEYMANPAAVGDSAGEWFELAVNTDVDLNGLELGASASGAPYEPHDILTDATCLRVTAGSYLLFARNRAADMNGGLPPIDFPLGFGLTNTDYSLFIGYAGKELDRASWTSVKAGYSKSLDPGGTTFCDAQDGDVYGDGDHGTPGEVNPACP